MDDRWHRAWQWLKARRQRAPHNADIWHLRHHAQNLLPEIWRQVQDGTYRLSPMLQVSPAGPGRDSDSLMMWSAADALVLKWVALTVAPDLRVHRRWPPDAGSSCTARISGGTAGIYKEKWPGGSGRKTRPTRRA